MKKSNKQLLVCFRSGAVGDLDKNEIDELLLNANILMDKSTDEENKIEDVDVKTLIPEITNIFPTEGTSYYIGRNISISSNPKTNCEDCD